MKRFSLFVLLVVAAIPAVSQGARASDVVGVKTRRLLHVRTGNYAADQMIWIEGGHIKAVGRSAAVQRQMPSGTRIIDLSNATVLPRLIDCHEHLTVNPSLFGPAQLQRPPRPRARGLFSTVFCRAHRRSAFFFMA